MFPSLGRHWDRFAWVWLLFSVVLFISGPVHAQSSDAGAWRPAKPVHLIAPFAPGGGADVIARLLGDQLSQSLGQPVVVENRPGANGSIGTGYVHAAAADGYTLMIGSVETHAINESLYPNLKYKPSEMSPIASVTRVVMTLCAKKDFPASNSRGVIDVAKQRDLSYGHWGIGSVGHLMMESIKRTAGIRAMQGIPYQGAGPVVSALMAGQVDLAFLPANTARASGDRIKCFATASASRQPGSLDLPTLREEGIDFDADAFAGVYASPKTPRPIVDSLNKSIRAIILRPDVQKRLLDMGLVPFDAGDAEAFERFMLNEKVRWAQMTSAAGARNDE